MRFRTSFLMLSMFLLVVGPGARAQSPGASPSARPAVGAGQDTSPRPTSRPLRVSRTLVMEAQSLLVFVNRTPLPEGGALDAATRAALKKFQASKGLEPSGTVDSATLDQLHGEVVRALHSLSYPQPTFDLAVQAFQKDHKLLPDGTFGPATRKTLEAAQVVRGFQEALTNEGFFKGKLNGVADGKAFEQALRDFQKARHLLVTGTLDEATVAALKAVVPTPSPSVAPSAVPSAAPAPTPAAGSGGSRLSGFLMGLPLGALLGALATFIIVRRAMLL